MLLPSIGKIVSPNFLAHEYRTVFVCEHIPFASCRVRLPDATQDLVSSSYAPEMRLCYVWGDGGAFGRAAITEYLPIGPRPIILPPLFLGLPCSSTITARPRLRHLPKLDTHSYHYLGKR
jgi:hypothetical protein